MSYLLDTDTFSALVRQRSVAALDRLLAVASGQVMMSVVSIAEVHFGLALKPQHARVLARVEALSRLVQALPLGVNVVPHYAGARATLQRLGTPIGSNDLWLAAHALAENLTLVTNNERAFRRVPGLRVENWLV